MARRKLQTEIDRTLKKVSEGVELFESIYDRAQADTNQSQKEKLDLMIQIKRLQRLRDQIKTWIASSDIEDKTLLLESRRLIETQMERFKAWMILGVPTWLQQNVKDLTLQVEQSEAEIESPQGSGDKDDKGTASHLDYLNERRKWHISRLELILRLLDNGSLTTYRVLTIAKDIAYFVESNAKDDFNENMCIYDNLHLEEEEAKLGLESDDNAEDVLDVEVPTSTPAATFDYDEPPSQAHSAHAEGPLPGPSHAVLRSPGVESAAPCPKEPLESIPKASRRLLPFEKWMDRISKLPDLFSPAEHSRPSTTTNKISSGTIIEGRRQKRTVFKGVPVRRAAGPSSTDKLVRLITTYFNRGAKAVAPAPLDENASKENAHGKSTKLPAPSKNTPDTTHVADQNDARPVPLESSIGSGPVTVRVGTDVDIVTSDQHSGSGKAVVALVIPEWLVPWCGCCKTVTVDGTH